MEVLDPDCWHIVFDYLESEPRAIYNCLFVSKPFFHLATKVLYRYPCSSKTTTTVFVGRCGMSTFSKLRLATLMDSCSGSLNPSTCFTDLRQGSQLHTNSSRPALTGEAATRSTTTTSSSSPSPLPSTSTTARSSLTRSTPTLSSNHHTLDHPKPLSALTPTINYYELVLEYPSIVSLPNHHDSHCQVFLSRYARTIPILQVSVAELDIILPFATSLRVLNTLIIGAPSTVAATTSSSSPSSSSSFPTTPSLLFCGEHLDKLLQFLQLHCQTFPGVLKTLETSSSQLVNWKELAVVQQAMKGMVKQHIVLDAQRQPMEQNLSELVVSRLRNLTLSCGVKNNLVLERKTIDLLKRCRGLETLALLWPDKSGMNLKSGWSDETSLSNSQSEYSGASQQQGIGGISSSTSSTSLSLSSLSTKALVRQQSGPVGLKHLFVLGNIEMVVEALEIFRETLESVRIGCNNNYTATDIDFGWQNRFKVPKLKSIQVERFSFQLENLVSCPVLETLELGNLNNRCTEYKFWNSTTRIDTTIQKIRIRMVLQITLRKLVLTGQALAGFDFVQLRPLYQLEELRLENDGSADGSAKSRRMINMSSIIHSTTTTTTTTTPTIGSWYFPNLRHISLHGRIGFQIQGQILWYAPRLESFDLNLLFQSRAHRLEPETFLYPPWELDFEGDFIQDDGLFLTAPSSTASSKNFTLKKQSAVVKSDGNSSESLDGSKMPCFSSLKSFKVWYVCLSKLQSLNAKTFGDVFFSPRQQQKTAVQEGCRNPSDEDYLFPNLERLEFSWNRPDDFMQSCVLQAMQNMPKLEYIRFRGDTLKFTRYDTLADWLQEVPQDQLGPTHEKYRRRPLPAVGLQGKNGNDRCVVEFDLPQDIRYQLNPNYGGTLKAMRTKVWKKIFS